MVQNAFADVFVLNFCGSMESCNTVFSCIYISIYVTACADSYGEKSKQDLRVS